MTLHDAIDASRRYPGLTTWTRLRGLLSDALRSGLISRAEHDAIFAAHYWR